MGLFDKIKDTAGSVAGSVKSSVETAKANHEQKKAEQEAYRAEMTAKATEKSEQIISSIEAFANEGSVFGDVDIGTLKSFAKEFRDKILLPASSVSSTHISMFPMISEKELDKFIKVCPVYSKTDEGIIYLKNGKQQIMITPNNLYFSVALDEDPKFFAKGKVGMDQISQFTFESDEMNSYFKCDDTILATFKTDKTIKEDFISLENFFDCISKKDFEITDEEVDKLIQEKIGGKVYAEVKKYMVYDDELMVYFAWGLDSLSAKDYIVCTTKQIIVMDREMFGMTANVKQFYYEDITSASTEQNSTSTDLTGMLIDAAITAATQTCDLKISVAGAVNKISTLYKVEAERVVAVYHQYRKLAKQASSQPQVIVQQQAESPVEQIKKLKDLADLGIITEEEFNQKKADLLAKM